MPPLVSKAATGRAQWLADRRTYLGATEIASILGLHPYSSPHKVWRAKMFGEEEESNIAMEAGLYMEPFIAKQFAALPVSQAMNLRIVKSKTYRHDKFPFLACNPDREIQRYRVEGKRVRVALECKRVGQWASRNFGQDGSDQIPEHYLVQIMWQMLIGKFDLVILAALIDDRKVVPYYYTFSPELSHLAHVFDKEAAANAFSFARNWWCRHIDNREEPDLTAADCDMEWSQRERATYENGQLCCPDEELGLALRALFDVQLPVLTQAEKDVKTSKNLIRQFMLREGASEMETEYGNVTFKTNSARIPSLRLPTRGQNA